MYQLRTTSLIRVPCTELHPDTNASIASLEITDLGPCRFLKIGYHHISYMDELNIETHFFVAKLLMTFE